MKTPKIMNKNGIRLNFIFEMNGSEFTRIRKNVER